MSSNAPIVSIPPTQRDSAYTTPRTDVFSMVPPSARHILDVGCSNGALGRSLRDAKPGRSVFGIEVDPRFAKEAADQLDHVINADLNLFDWRQSLVGHSFDCIIFADVLEHLVDPRRCLLQARQHLQAGGCVVVSVPNIRHLSALRAIFLGGRFPQRDRGIFDRTHLRWYTIADAHSLLSDSQFKVTATRLTLRWGDLGGGRANRFLNRLPAFLQQWTPVREFLTYQVCLRAEVSA